MSFWAHIFSAERCAGIAERCASVGLITATVVCVYMQYLWTVSDEYNRHFTEMAPAPKSKFITQDTEDALPEETLSNLMVHYNYSIRETAAKIVQDRAVHDEPTLRHLVWGIAQPEYEERTRHLQALAMLTDNSTLERLHTRAYVGAFVRSLEHCVEGSEDEARRIQDRALEPGHDSIDSIDSIDEDDDEPGYVRRAIRPAGDVMARDITYDGYQMRDMAEKLCIVFVSQLVDRFGAELVVEAGFVEKWLARQRWVEEPGPSDPAERAALRIRRFEEYLHTGNSQIVYLCLKIHALPEGRTALERAGLIAPRRKRRSVHCTQHAGRHLTAGSLRGSRETSREPEPDRGDPGRSEPGAIPADREADREPDRDFAPTMPSPLRAQLRVVNGGVVSEGAPDDVADAGQTDQPGQTAQTDQPAQTAQTAQTRQTRQTETVPEARRQTNSLEEQRIRRQHREAMVLNDGTRPLGRSDIIERESE